MKKKLRITVKGQTYEVIAEILDEEVSPVARTASVLPSPIAPVAPAAAPAAAPKATPVAAVAGAIPSPIAGTVVTIVKAVGAEVAAGDVLVVLEAMKMNTEVTAPSAGKVSAVHVAVGQTIEEGQSLVSLA
jgi:glutaconyl-CoA/methylmalonyl-CoA decarboxylase subunit gamma